MEKPLILKIANMKWFTDDIKHKHWGRPNAIIAWSASHLTPCVYSHTHTSVKLRISASSVRSRVFGGSEDWESLCLAHRCLLKTQPILLHLLYSSLNILSFAFHTFLALVFLGLRSRLLFLFPFPRGLLLVAQCLSVQFQHRNMSLTPPFPHILSNFQRLPLRVSRGVLPLTVSCPLTCTLCKALLRLYRSCFWQAYVRPFLVSGTWALLTHWEPSHTHNP